MWKSIILRQGRETEKREKQREMVETWERKNRKKVRAE